MDSKTLTREIVIPNRKGLHARASAKFVRCVEKFDAQVRVTRDDQTVGGTSIMGLMMLGAGIGSTIQLDVTGRDAEACLAALLSLIENKFDELE